MSNAPNVCPGCGHSLARHYRAMDSTVRCLVVESGTSSSGVIGLPWSQECDCTDQKSLAAIHAAEYEAYEEATQREWLDGISRSVRGKYNALKPKEEIAP